MIPDHIDEEDRSLYDENVPFVPMGWSGDRRQLFHFFVRARGGMVSLTGHQLEHGRYVLTLLPDRAWWRERHGTWRECGASLRRACEEVGYFSPAVNFVTARAAMRAALRHTTPDGRTLGQLCREALAGNVTSARALRRYGIAFDADLADFLIAQSHPSLTKLLHREGEPDNYLPLLRALPGAKAWDKAITFVTGVVKKATRVPAQTILDLGVPAVRMAPPMPVMEARAG